MILKKLSQSVKKYGLMAFVYRAPPYLAQFPPDAIVSFKIRFVHAMHLERRERIEEAIKLLKQAADFFPPSGFEYFGRAAELAERNSMYKEACLLWFESLCQTPVFQLKLISFRNAVKNLTLGKLNQDCERESSISFL
ncbi:hypothetical protein E3J49_03355 [Candidatus Bathyarchaeota archaeon]|nr:MAG: hypothetical protein E3J49_03355 [Candidatus Bathyarchaeota archaeon]